MRSFLIAALAVMVVGLVGCQNGTNLNPYDSTDALVKGDDLAVTQATAAVTIGVLPVADADSIYTADNDFVVLGMPLVVAADQASAAPTLAPNAVTLATLTADIAQLKTDLLALHKAASAAVVAKIKAVTPPSR